MKKSRRPAEEDWEAPEEDPGGLPCPICGRLSGAGDDCDHVVLACDLGAAIDEVVCLAGESETWDQITDLSEDDYVSQSSAFLREFVHPCWGAHVEEYHWGGECPGRDGYVVFIWARSPDKLADRIAKRLTHELAYLLELRAGPDEEQLDATVRTVMASLEEQGGAIVDPRKARILTAEAREEYPPGEPSDQERRKRQRLLRWARYAAELSGDRTCGQMLEGLERFCSGTEGYSALANRTLWGARVVAAGCVGLVHFCTNAAATLACYHAAHPYLDEATKLTRTYVAMTVDFSERARALKR